MSGEVIVAWGTNKVLCSSGPSITNNFVQQAVLPYDAELDGGGFPDAQFVLSVSFATAPVEGMAIVLMARPLGVDNLHDEEMPEATRATKTIGTFIVNNVTTLQVMDLLAYDVPKNASYFLYNNGTGQTISDGWTLSVNPRTLKVAP